MYRMRNQETKTMEQIVPGDVVQHFKRDLTGNTDPNLYLYRIVGETKHTETNETLVIYQDCMGISRCMYALSACS